MQKTPLVFDGGTCHFSDFRWKDFSFLANNDDKQTEIIKKTIKKFYIYKDKILERSIEAMQ